MSLSATIAPHLPSLRRFARALTGSQASGDSYAMTTLEALVADGTLPREAAEMRRTLFSVFLRIWSSVPINHQPEVAAPEGAVGVADRRLEAITPLPRVAFLLRASEGFSTADIALMLQRPVSEVENLLDQAGREIAAQISTQVLIIEDEPIIAMDLEALVLDLGHEVLQIARTHTEAVAAIRQRKPGLVLADIHLADGSSGLDAVHDILKHCEVPVVFITAYPERLLTGTRPEPTFLITKPFRPETVKAVVSQALFFDRKVVATSSARPANAGAPAAH
jgi:CheY-like chemotaxis protein